VKNRPASYLIKAQKAVDPMGEELACMSGPTCKTPGRQEQVHPSTDPLCGYCIEASERDVRALVFDYLDLAQLHAPAMSQAINEHTSGGSPESPMPLIAHVEALQAEIVHVTAMWEYELRVVCRLSNPATFAPLWRSTVYDQVNLTTGDLAVRKARAGVLVQRAVAVIAPRLGNLARLPETIVCPAGVEDEPVPMYGWEAVHQLVDLHGRARSALGRTVRKFWIPGECWHCAARPTPGVDGPLWRTEPQYADPGEDGRRDPMQVCCSHCAATRPYADYEAYQATLLWPGQASDDNVRVAA
jgi:hypothetical protein